MSDDTPRGPFRALHINPTTGADEDGRKLGEDWVVLGVGKDDDGFTHYITTDRLKASDFADVVPGTEHAITEVIVRALNALYTRIGVDSYDLDHWDEVLAEAQRGAPAPRPVLAYEWGGAKWATNGHIALREGERPPRRWCEWRTPERGVPQESFAELLTKAANEATEEVGGWTQQEFKHPAWRHMSQHMEAGSPVVWVDPVLHAPWRDAAWFRKPGEQLAPLVVKRNGEIVAVVMPLRPEAA